MLVAQEIKFDDPAKDEIAIKRILKALKENGLSVLSGCDSHYLIASLDKDLIYINDAISNALNRKYIKLSKLNCFKEEVVKV